MFGNSCVKTFERLFHVKGMESSVLNNHLRPSLLFFLVAVLSVVVSSSTALAYFRVEVPVDKKSTLPVYVFLPQCGVSKPLPAVVVGVGVGGTQIAQYREHCQLLADRNYVVALIDPSNHPEEMAPGPWNWDRGAGYMLGSLNQGVVATKLFFGNQWYLKTIGATVNYLICSPWVDKSRIALSGFSQPANAALAYACKDPRIKAVIWNYGGWPWVMPYEPFRLPPVQIFHGEKDDVYDVKYARELAMNLKTSMRPHEVNIYPDQKHMFNIYYDLRTENRFMKPAMLDAFERMVGFLSRTLGHNGKN